MVQVGLVVQVGLKVQVGLVVQVGFVVQVSLVVLVLGSMPKSAPNFRKLVWTNEFEQYS